MYFYGIGIEQNEKQAFYWYSKAGEDGHVKARDILLNNKRITFSIQSLKLLVS